MELNGKTALVTGGTDGIGARMIRQLRDKGVNVITSGRDPARCAATRADGFEVIEADLSLPEGVAALLAAVAERDRKSTRLNSSHIQKSRMPSSA